MIFGILFWIGVLVVFYVYLGYPLLVAVLARLRKPRRCPEADLPGVTLIFAAHNEEKVITQKLENSLILDYPRERLQILVVDDGSTDQTAEITRAYQDRGIELIHFDERRGKLSALKDALNGARGEIILFSDADNLYPPDALREAVRCFADPSVGAVSGGRNVIGKSALGGAESLYWKYEEFIKRQESRLGSCVGVAGDLLAIRKALFVAPPNGIINDDFYMALGILKQGYRVAFAPRARSYHPVAPSEQGEIERRTRMVAGRYQAIFFAWRMLPFKHPVVVWQVISHKYLRPLVPFAMILAFLANLLALLPLEKGGGPAWLALASPFNWIAFILQMVFYLMAWVGMRVKRRGWLGKLLYLPTFLVNSNLAAILGLYRFLSAKQSVVWKKAARQ